ncbi:MAG: hypothetical protein GTN38_04625 [Candidatus Aenigmarchaeota archaeon]|nr:hypothetical protein [Candidatus Aenigmarchaeota archaeon]NIP41033.1 hypothetical protein [Candidatus Aenigmarchaeota archaeon]NIQ17435.1 hypothetical protein [Candidatus Aenigmarchaeota archaeon]NIS73629.1 hypothetical protein [Candidatus Aenigmarchaeota archaeon]
MLQSTPPPQTTQDIAVQEERLSEEDLYKLKEPLFELKESLKVSASKNPYTSESIRPNIQNSLDFSIGKVIGISNWTDVGLIGGRDIDDIYNETQLYLFPKFPIHPVGEVDLCTGSKAVVRGGVSTGWFAAPFADRLKMNVDIYPVSNVKDAEGRKEGHLWVKVRYETSSGLAIGGMTKQFTTRVGDGDRKSVYNIYGSIPLGNGWELEIAGWRNPNDDNVFMIGIRKGYKITF